MLHVKNKIIVYTAISNNYDNLKTCHENEHVNYLAFVSDEYLNDNVFPWKQIAITNTSSDNNRNAKKYKILPHLYLPPCDYSLWIDGAIKMSGKSSIQSLIDIYLKNDDLVAFKHKKRNCLYDEAKVCLSLNLDNKNTIIKQIERYKEDNYPVQAGLITAPVLLRRHSEKMNQFNEAWWAEIENGSKRDQISFNYVAKKLNFNYNTFPCHLCETIEGTDFSFRRTYHKRK